VRFTVEPYRRWLQRIDCYDDNFQRLLTWIERMNEALFRRFDGLYGS
jgi:hypothetical protein